MDDSFRLADSDRLLIDALQIAPRASWATIGDVLDLNPVTAARRWQRLVDAGVAWVTTGPGMASRNAQCLAYVEITCRPGWNLRVAEALAADPLALTVELTTGSADVLVTVAGSDLTVLSGYLLGHVGQVHGVVSTRSRVATRLYSEGSTWRIGGLSDHAVEELRRSRVQSAAPRTYTVGSGALPASVRRIIGLLALDGRASYTDLAAHAGVSPATARRHVTRLLESGTVLPRTDVSAPICGWPVQVYLWATAPVSELAAAARDISQLRQTRLCASLAAAPSLMVAVWLRTVEEVHRLELAIAKNLPYVDVVDRLLVLRPVKRMGRLLDESGRAIIPVNQRTTESARSAKDSAADV